MSAFIDANVLVYAVSEGEFQPPCDQLLELISAGEIEAATSVTVLEELWHLELSGRVPKLAGQTRRARIIFDRVLAVGPHTLDLALALDASAALGANDRLHIASCTEHEIATIVSADRDFDGIETLTRVDPLHPQLLALLGVEADRPEGDG